MRNAGAQGYNEVLERRRNGCNAREVGHLQSLTKCGGNLIQKMHTRRSNTGTIARMSYVHTVLGNIPHYYSGHSFIVLCNLPTSQPVWSLKDCETLPQKTSNNPFGIPEKATFSKSDGDEYNRASFTYHSNSTWQKYSTWQKLFVLRFSFNFSKRSPNTS